MKLKKTKGIRISEELYNELKDRISILNSKREADDKLWTFSSYINHLIKLDDNV